MTECRKGNLCATRDRDGNPGMAGSLGLCLSCEYEGYESIRKLPGDYVSLYAQLGPSGSSTGSSIPSGRVEAPIPIRLGIEAQLREIHWTLREWVIPVSVTLKLSDRDVFRMSHPFLVSWASSVIANSYSVLLALGNTRYRSYDTGGYQVTDGVGAAMLFSHVHRRSISLAGDTGAWESRSMPCPNTASGCGRYELGTWIGTGIVVCRSCGWQCSMGDYEKYVLTFVPNGSRYGVA